MYIYICVCLYLYVYLNCKLPHKSFNASLCVRQAIDFMAPSHAPKPQIYKSFRVLNKNKSAIFKLIQRVKFKTHKWKIKVVYQQLLPNECPITNFTAFCKVLQFMAIIRTKEERYCFNTNKWYIIYKNICL